MWRPGPLGFETVEGGAQQPYRTLAGLGLLEQRDGARDDLLLRRGRRLARFAARDRLEIRVPELQHDGSRQETFPGEHRRGVSGEHLELAADLVDV